VQQEFAQRENVLSHTNILAPVEGIVKYLRINTQGGVMRPGDELVQISPTESELT
ncbi:MAG: HlyD family efflux transporter periplasmic adaptor subunit, partial [Gammaproteobacteria bacterium]|nr:HlyD family efflux transporter periplasmic adaptor subunit [Gammaproteobacteria bacterium]